MINFRRFMYFFGLFVLVFVSGCAGKLTKEEAMSSATEVFNEASQRAVGASAAIAVNGKIVWLGNHGYANQEVGVKADADTLYRVYSLVKPMTVAASLSLVQQKKLNPDSPIANYLDEYDGPGKDNITARMLATHKSGIRHYQNNQEGLGDKNCKSVDDALSIFEHSPLKFEPGSKQGYSSWGFVLLSKLLEEVAGQSFDQVMNEHVFKPANMSGIQHDDPEQEIVARASSYVIDGGQTLLSPKLDNSCKWGAGGYVANSIDVVNFLSALATPGQLVSEESVELIFRGKSEYAAIGWNEGGMGYMRVARDKNIAVVILTNTRDRELGTGYNELLKELSNIFAKTDM